MARAIEAIKRMRSSFYKGPDWIEMPDIEFRGYRSPTALLAIWAAAILFRLASPAGAALCGLLAALAMYSTILPRNNVAMMLFAILALCLVDFFANRLFHPKLEISRRTPERVRAGAELEIGYRLKNRGSLPAWDLVLDPGLPSKALSPLGASPSFVCVPGRGEARESFRFLARRRGVFQLPRPLAESCFPFGLFKSSCRWGLPQTLIVHPAFSRLESLRLPGGPRLQKLGLAAVSKVGESMEFHGCREFRAGDDPRKLHWLGTARMGEPVVKEFQEERLNKVALILDTCCAKPSLLRSLSKAGPDEASSKAFEAAVSLTAAIAEHLARGEFIIDLFATGGKAWRFRGGRSLAQLDDILDILSCVEPSFEGSFEPLDASLFEEISSIGAVVAVMTRPDAKAESFCSRIAESGAGIRPIAVSSAPAPSWAEAVSPEDVLEGRALRL